MTGRGAALVIGAAALWGTLGVAARAAFRAGLSPLEASLWRAGGAFVALLVVSLVARPAVLRVPPRDVPLFAAYGLVSVAAFMTVYLNAIRLTSVATAAMLLYTAPAWVAGLSRLFFGEPLTRRKLGAIALATAGTALLVGAYDPRALRLNLPGVLSGLGAGLTYALYSIFGKSALRRHGPFTTLLYALGFGAVFLLAAARRLPPVPAGALPTLLYLALVPTLLSHTLYINGLRSLEAGRAAILATVEPVVAALLGLLLLGEALDIPQWAGGGLILAAVILAAGATPDRGGGRHQRCQASQSGPAPDRRQAS